MKLTYEQFHALATAPVVLWRAKVATLGCTVISPQKRWAGVQVGLRYFSGRIDGGKQAGPRSVYYDADVDI